MRNLVLELLCEARTVVSRSRPGTREKRTCAHRRHRLRHFKHKSHISKPSMPRSWIPLPSTFEETEFFLIVLSDFPYFVYRIFSIKKNEFKFSFSKYRILPIKLYTEYPIVHRTVQQDIRKILFFYRKNRTILIQGSFLFEDPRYSYFNVFLF